MKPKRKAVPVGRGVSIKEYLQKPDVLVTRGELWEMFKLYDSGRQRNTWWRRLWRRLMAPIVPPRGQP